MRPLQSKWGVLFRSKWWIDATASAMCSKWVFVPTRLLFVFAVIKLNRAARTQSKDEL